MIEIIKNIIENQEGKGANFMGIREYKSNKSGEIANFVVNFGISYGNAKTETVKILNSLTDSDFEAIASKGVNNIGGIQYATNKGASEYLESGKLPKEGTKAREQVLNGVKTTKTLSEIRDEIVKSMLNNDDEQTRSNQSKGQENAYTHLGRGVKQHLVSKDIYFYANSHIKDIIEDGKYAESTPLPETIQKNAISKYCKYVLKNELPTDKFRMFVVSPEQIGEVKVTGNTYQFI